MATQGQVRARLIQAVRACRRVERRLNSKDEEIYRELSRLVKRKTLINPSSLDTSYKLWKEFSTIAVEYQKALSTLYDISAANIPQ
jgi:hypothetical protein